MRHAKTSLFLLTPLLVFLCTCTNPFAPAIAPDDIDEDGLLTNQNTPEDVLTNFVYAYSFKDSLVYADLIDSSFTFVSINYNTSPPQPINWGRDEELRSIGRMFRFFNTLDLTWNSVITNDTLEVDSTSMKANLIEQELTFTLTLDGGSAIPTLIGRVEYIFIRHEQTNGEDRWFILFWEDKDI